MPSYGHSVLKVLSSHSAWDTLALFKGQVVRPTGPTVADLIESIVKFSSCFCSNWTPWHQTDKHILEKVDLLPSPKSEMADEMV